MRVFIIFILICLLGGVYSCNKESFNHSADARVVFSSDTLFFDTVFTSKGSVTQSFKIINDNGQKLRLNSIRLAGGNQSPFKININGVSSENIQNEVIDANDSIYVFVQVNVDPGNQTQPFLLEDSIEVQYNGIKRWMQLRAYGQNAVFFKDVYIENDTTWSDHLPIVITGFLQVDSGAVLKIEQGCSIFVQATAPVIVNGTLNVQGTVLKPVVFAGDRRDADYKDLPAAWPGIYFTETSKDNVLKSTVIKNAYQGIIAEQMPDNGNPKVTISQSKFENIYDAGILALNSTITADNSLIVNCGSNIALLLGGEYNFVNCTIATYGSFYINHKNPVLQASDYFEQSGTVFTSDLHATFTNCILWGDNGSVDNEIFLEKKGTGMFQASFDHCIYKAKDAVTNATFNNSYLNSPPLFDSIDVSKNYYDFHFKTNPESPALKSGTPVAFLYDLDGVLRNDPPDIGCYER